MASLWKASTLAKPKSLTPNDVISCLILSLQQIFVLILAQYPDTVAHELSDFLATKKTCLFNEMMFFWAIYIFGAVRLRIHQLSSGKEHNALNYCKSWKKRETKQTTVICSWQVDCYGILLINFALFVIKENQISIIAKIKCDNQLIV